MSYCIWSEQRESNLILKKDSIDIDIYTIEQVASTQMYSSRVKIKYNDIFEPIRMLKNIKSDQ